MINVDNAVDVVKKINKYFDDERGSSKMSKIVTNVSKIADIIDKIEELADGIPSDHFSDQFHKNIGTVRMSITNMLNSIDDIHEVVNK